MKASDPGAKLDVLFVGTLFVYLDAVTELRFFSRFLLSR